MKSRDDFTDVVDRPMSQDFQIKSFSFLELCNHGQQQQIEENM